MSFWFFWFLFFLPDQRELLNTDDTVSITGSGIMDYFNIICPFGGNFGGFSFGACVGMVHPFPSYFQENQKQLIFATSPGVRSY